VCVGEGGDERRGSSKVFRYCCSFVILFLAFSSKCIFTRRKLLTHAHAADFRESIYLTSLNRVRINIIIIIILRYIHNIMIIHNLCVYFLRAARKNIIGIVKSQKELWYPVL